MKRAGNGRTPESLSYTLLQFRDAGDPMREQEALAFVETLGVPADRLRTVDATRQRLDGPALADVLDGADVLLVGGAGSYSIYDEHPWIQGFLDFMRRVADRRRPTFASCFGFQALCVALGGEVVQDPAGGEVGSFRLHKTPEGRADLLFGSLPDPFWAQMGHKDMAESLPAGLLNLARSDQCPYQACRLDDAPVYATQFHPELNRARNLERFHRSIENYAPDGAVEAIDAVVAAHRETPEANGLLRAFVERVVLGDDGNPRR